MDTLRGIESFVKAVETGSIAAGARLLGISAAAASQNIARLESSLGVRLLTRTTRSLALTESGTLYFEQVRDVLRDLELARSTATQLHDAPEGRLRIAASAAFGRHVLAALLPAFSARYPRIACELITTDRSVNHIRESVDISIRIPQQLEDGLVARHIASVPSIYCASPAYLHKAGTPVTPEQLREHDCLAFRVAVDGRLMPWRFVRDGVRFDAQIRVALVSDDIDVLARVAVNGGGITRLAAFVAEPWLASGLLQQLFASPQRSGSQALVEPLDYYLCVRDRYELTPKVRAFVEHLQGSLRDDWRP
ncbi:DNA-binding transcriptional regulator, LysR family [Pseudomonas flavescens]|uniref:DNA-binding transcriptional regulator, LysR family n=1 Tax=Phytopseudomonas flavescens TaxID=29435 RepID=A0A1G7XW50_9GAMM|nr:LysR family transcriptional regulator [Pseudomonas flavescens]SDG88246.1 DNA-binding transcriptional regulator, LysR family [Pseudomonas flavescens]